MGGGYSEGYIEEELAEFLGVDVKLIAIDEREYAESFDVNLPQENDIEDDYKQVTKQIINNYSNIIDLVVQAEVYPVGGAGYASGESEPTEDPNYTIKATISLFSYITTVFITMLSKNISHTTFINKNDVDDYINKYYKDIKQSKEFMSIISNIKAKNKLFQIDYHSIGIAKSYSEYNPEDAEAKIEKQVKSFSLALEDIANPSNYPELVKDIQNTYGESEEEDLNEIKYVFKRLMGR
jgi:thiol-disulfide isomerase/thioredoxin